MKKLIFIYLTSFLVSTVHLFSQGSLDLEQNLKLIDSIPTIEIAAPDLEQLKAEDFERENQGLMYRIGVATTVNINPENAGLWSNLPNGSRKWQIIIKSKGAEALSFLFDKFVIYGETTLEITDIKGTLVHQKLTSKDVLYHKKLNAALCFGDELILTLIEPKNTKTSEIHIERVIYNYRSTGNPNFEKINESQSCHVNINCYPVGLNWDKQKRGITKIYATNNTMAGFLTGSLINNTSQDCKPYVLTALNSFSNINDSEFNFWIFYFNFQSSNCDNPFSSSTVPNKYISGCFKVADSGDNGGETGSDFLLLHLGDTNNVNLTVTKLLSNDFKAFWNGWSINSNSTAGGACIHHPVGDIKKISTSTETPENSSWQNNDLNSHWRIRWTSNTNGYGITEDGSTGAPFFDNQGYIIGTLTGGESSCEDIYAPNYFGKMSYHWDSNDTSNIHKLKPWLDPLNLGYSTILGSYNPCSTAPPPIAQFTANTIEVPMNSDVSFTDLSTGYITNWYWSINPSTGWEFVNSPFEQNPIVRFNSAQTYTVTLTASNPNGSSIESKYEYIKCYYNTTYCTPEPTVQDCVEYIYNVSVSNLNKTSLCSDNGYELHSEDTIFLNRGEDYSISIKPRQVGAVLGTGGFINDNIMVWIDFNNNTTFNLEERIVNDVIVSDEILEYTYIFTVPQNASYHNSLVRMRVLLGYNYSANYPCAYYEYGETEDYLVKFNGGILENHENELSLATVYPNPFDDKLSIDLSEVLEEVNSISILDITGKIIEHLPINQNKVIDFDMSSFSKGLYIVRIQSNNQTFDKKVVK